jgi:antitoxin component YwqK of YwqJK toxin-antitoxin module
MAPQNVKLDPTPSFRSISHPDGTTTEVSVNASGQITRSVTFTADDGASVTITSNGAGEVSEVRSYPDGHFYIEERLPDGTRSVKDDQPQPDGSRLTVAETTYPDGRIETSTERAQTLPDGTTFEEVHNSDGSTVVSTAHPDGRFVSTETFADGSPKSSASSVNTPDGWVMKLTDAQGRNTVIQNSYDQASGVYTTVTTLPDGGVETETERTQTYPDGRTVYEHTGADGTATTRIERSDGSIDSSIVHPDGTTETSQKVVYPDGRLLTETVNTDGTRESTLQVTRPDGSVETTHNDTDGNTTRSVLAPDGSVDRRTHHSDGSTEHTGVGPEGMGTTTLTEPDGTTMVLDQYVDPALEVDPASTPDDLHHEPPVLEGTDSPLVVDDLAAQPATGDAQESPAYQTAESLAVEGNSAEHDADVETYYPATDSSDDYAAELQDSYEPVSEVAYESYEPVAAEVAVE